MSDRITVRSIVGRYLEHSRIFRFGVPGRAGTEYIIGSADMMPRNLDRRVEAMLRVTGDRLRGRLDEILRYVFEDDSLAWRLEADGTWEKVPVERRVDVQVVMQELAIARTRARADT